MEGNCEKRITALISTIVHKLARSKCCRAVGNPLISAIQERNKREKERERGIDRVVKDGRKKMTEGGSRGGEGIKRRKSRYVSSRYVFIRRVKLSRGFYVFIYLSLSLSLSPLSSRLATNMYRAGSVYAFARGLWTVSGPCRLEVAFSFNPFVLASRSFLRQRVSRRPV